MAGALDEYPRPEFNVEHKESLMILVKDAEFGAILNDIVLGMYTMIDLRVGNLQKEDPFRCRIMLWCEYIIEMMLMCIDIINAHKTTHKAHHDLRKFVLEKLQHTRFSVRIGKRKKRNRHTKRKIPSRHLKRFSVDVIARAVTVPVQAMAVPSEDQKPQTSSHVTGPVRLGRAALLEAAKKFAEEPMAFDALQSRFKRNQKIKLERQLKEEDGETDRPLDIKYAIWEYHLALLGQQCEHEVNAFFEAKLGAHSIVKAKVKAYYKMHAREVVDFSVVSARLYAFLNYIEAYEEQFADVALVNRRMDIFEYKEKLLEFLKKPDWETFDPVGSGLMRYSGHDEWTPAYQVGLME